MMSAQHGNSEFRYPQPSGGHSSSYMQHGLYINLQADVQNAKGWAGNHLSVQKETKKSRSGVFSLLMKHNSELSHKALFLPYNKTRAEVYTQVANKWANCKLRDKLSCHFFVFERKRVVASAPCSNISCSENNYPEIKSSQRRKEFQLI